MRDVMLALVVLAGCAASPRALPARHPAQPSATSGRLAGAPPALRPGVVQYKDVPPTRSGPPPDHSHHHH